MFKNLPQSFYFEELNISSTSVFQKLKSLRQLNLGLLMPLQALRLVENKIFAIRNIMVDVDQINPKS